MKTYDNSSKPTGQRIIISEYVRPDSSKSYGFMTELRDEGGEVIMSTAQFCGDADKLVRRVKEEVGG